MARRPGHRARAFTLAEMAVSLSIATVLLVSMGSVMVLASRAIPDPDSRAARAIEAARALEIIADDLAYAQTIAVASRINATVADRNGDKADERVKYGVDVDTDELVAVWSDPDQRTLVLLDGVATFSAQAERDGAATVAVTIEITLMDMPGEPFRRRVQLVNGPE